MIDFNYTAPELLPFRIQEVLDAPNEPHRIGGVVYVPEGGGECEVELRESGWGGYTRHCGACGADLDCDTRNKQNYCPHCGFRIRKVVKR